MVLIHPPSKIGQQESEHFPMPVIEEPRIPQLVVSHITGVEVLVVRAIKLVEAIHAVIGRMRVNNIDEDVDAQGVCGINHGFELLRRSESRGCCEKVGHVVSKRCVVRMFHNRHDLNGVVAQPADAWQDHIAKLVKGTDLWLLTGHPDMHFINAERFRCLGMLRPLPLILDLSWWVPIDHIVEEALWVLYAVWSPCWVTVEPHTSWSNHT
mmetsp:Transcript_16602/g.29070  ORF Transcript_16602/g.29070 Transcript_16602/m.29070 type:complete len:210 (-) Transcript_16602:506-1135(-)